jgi:hypothetical protein
VYLVNDLTRAGSLIAQDGGFVISLVVAWLAADSSVPLTASGTVFYDDCQHIY